MHVKTNSTFLQCIYLDIQYLFNVFFFINMRIWSIQQTGGITVGHSFLYIISIEGLKIRHFLPHAIKHNMFGIRE